MAIPKSGVGVNERKYRFATLNGGQKPWKINGYSQKSSEREDQLPFFQGENVINI
jgi:hypothetical protein